MTASSAIVDSVLSRQRRLRDSQPARIVPRAAVGFIVSVLSITELRSRLLEQSLSSWGDVSLFWSASCSAALAWGLLTLVHAVYTVIFPFGWAAGDVALTKEQMRLLGVEPNTKGFCLLPEKAAIAHPNPSNPPMKGNLLRSPTTNHAALFAANSNSPSPGQGGMSPMSPDRHQAVGGASAIATTPGGATSPISPRSRGLEMPSEVRDEQTLRRYLKRFEAWERSQQGPHQNTSLELNTSSPNMSNMSLDASHSFWKPQQAGSPPCQDYSPVLKNLHYSLSVPMPKTLTAPNTPGDKGHATDAAGGSQDVLQRHRLLPFISDPLETISWLENLRLYLSQTIIARVLKQLDATNKALSKLGLDLQLGEVGLERVKRAVSLHPQMPGLEEASLSHLIPFLEISVHQDYLINRIRELGTGGAMSCFKWNGGGRYKNKDWSDVLPTDAELVMHLFVSYMDARLPPLGGIVDGRAFSARYFFRLSEESKAEVEKATRKVPIAIVQTRLGTAKEGPQYVLHIGSSQVEVSPGRNNMFHTLLAFIHYLAVKESGMLDRISLDRAGLNMMWIIQEQTMKH